MKAVYDSHVLKFREVRLDRDHRQLAETLSACRGGKVVVRVRHAGGSLEIERPGADLAEQLRGASVDPSQPFDLEIVTRQPAHLDRNGGAPPSPDGFVDRNDLNVLQWNGSRGTGKAAPGTLRHTPMFFRENGMNFDLVDLHLGQTLFLVLNGPSLADFDGSRLREPGIVTLGINNGAHRLRPNYWTCVDDPTRFMASIWKDPAIVKIVPMAHFQKPIWDRERGTFSAELVRDFPNVVGYRRNEAFAPGRWLVEDTINWGNHSKRGGGRSVMLAALRIAHLLGFRRVYLLGCDFQMDESRHYWFPEQRSANAISNNTSSYAIMRGYFQQLQPTFLEAGFEVFNCNPQSRLEVFPFADLDEALDRARIDVAESTEGMYIDRYREAKQRDEAARRQADAPAGKGAGAAKPAGRVGTAPSGAAGKALDHLLATIGTAAVSRDPFVHIRLHDAFPESFYAEMLARLPADRSYSELKHTDAMQSDGRSARLQFAFSARELAALEPPARQFWSEVRAMLTDRRVDAALRRALAPGLRQRFADKADRVPLRPVPTLIRDLDGYRIGVHTDIFQKAITCQFYLPEDASRPALGTTFCRRGADGRPREAMTLPFVPRSGYAFAVTKDSLHEVRRLDLDGRPRNSLMLTYYLRET